MDEPSIKRIEMINRNESIDSLKGLLIVFVILGHSLLGSLDDNAIRYVIYSFHMPVFLFLSGYLINYEKISDLSIKELGKKYWKRMLFPWTVALVVYSVFLNATDFTLHALVRRLAIPYYHLWYVPTLFVFILMTWLLSKFKSKTISVILLIGTGLMLDKLYLQTETFRLNYLIFFAVGVMVRNVKLRVDNLRLGGGILCLFLITIIILAENNITMDFYRRNLMMPFMMVVCLLSVLPVIIIDGFKCSALGFIGEHSLEVYLWHVLPIIILKHFIPDAQASYLYYLLIIALIVMLLVFSWIKTKKVTVNS